MTPTTSYVSQLPLAMRDTALTIASLHTGDFPHDGFKLFRELCEAQLQRLRQELEETGQPADDIDDALYAQCALLDETVLRCLKTEHREEWELRPLQVTQFSSHDAGEELIRRMQARLHAPQADLRLLLIFHSVLQLGFRGKFTEQTETERVELMSELARRITGTHQQPNPDERCTVTVATGAARRWPGLTSLALVMLTSLLAALLYGALQHWLSTSITALTQQ